jgi:toxin ParE1/3/4
MTAKTYRIAWRPMAREDLRAIVAYIGKDNPTRAKSFGKELRDKTKPLAQHPELGHPGRLPGIRELVVHRNYIVFYRVLAQDRTVEILRVRHAAQQLP